MTQQDKAIDQMTDEEADAFALADPMIADIVGERPDVLSVEEAPARKKTTKKVDAASAERREQIRVRLDKKTQMQLQYWADKEGISVNQFIMDAIDMRIAYKNNDFPMTNLMMDRQNEIIDLLKGSSSSLETLIRMVTVNFDALNRVMRDENYLGAVHETEELG